MKFCTCNDPFLGRYRCMRRILFIFILIQFQSAKTFGQERSLLDSSAFDVVCYYPSSNQVKAWGSLEGIIPHGEWVLFHQNGQLSARGKFRNGKRHGKWKFYDVKGDLIERGRYRKGNKHGIWIVHEDKFVLFDNGLVVDQNVFK